MLYRVQVAVLNVEESIEHHARLAQAQIQVEAHKAFLHIDRMIQDFKIQDFFNTHRRD